MKFSSFFLCRENVILLWLLFGFLLYLLLFFFWSLKMIGLGVVLGGIDVARCSLSFLDVWFVVWYQFWKNSPSVFFQTVLLFLSFFSSCYSRYVYTLCFVAVPQSLDIPFCFFSLLSLLFTSWGSTGISSSSEIFSSAMSCV